MRVSTVWRRGVLSAVVVLWAVLSGCGVFPTSSERLIGTARTGTAPSDRREALVELRGRAEPYMRQDLETALGQELDPASRALAAELLGQIGDPASAPELSRSVRLDTQWIVRMAALDALAGVQGAGALEDIRHASRNDPQPEVRADAALLARRYLEKDDALALLLEALNDGAAVVRLQASAMLKELTGLSAPPNAEGWQNALQAAPAP